MTITPDTVLGSDLEFFTAEEQEHALALRRDAESATTLTEVGLAISGAFMFYRLYMTKRLRREIRSGLTAQQLAATTQYHFRKFLPLWSFVTVPAMVRAMILGSPDRDMPPELIYAMADDYARRVGGYLNDTSADALLEGFNAYTNKRTNRVLAANKALDGFGLTKKQTRALVAKKERPPVSSTRTIPIDRDREFYVEQAAFSRALTVGDNEAYAASQHGKQIGWMFLAREGRISSDAKRMWITARDERVCKACGPMHRKTAKIDEPFDGPSGEVWAPSLHPNCRCTMALRGVIKGAISKDLYGGELAEFNRKVRRDDDGRFTFKPKLKEAEADPQLDEMLRQATELKNEPQKVDLGGRISLGKPKVSLTPKISLGGNLSMESPGVSMPQASIPKLAISAMAIQKLEMEAEKLGLQSQKVVITPRPKKTPPPPAPEHIPLDEDLEFLDFEGGLWPEGEPMDLDDTVVMWKSHSFYTPDDIDQDTIPTAYKNLAEQLTREVIARGHYKMVDEHGNKVPIRMSPAAIKASILAELSGDTGSPKAREAAEMMGIRREAYTSNLYIISSAYPDIEDLGGYYAAPGPYRVEMKYPVADTGYPVRHVRIVPLSTKEYEKWLATEGHQGD